MWYDGHVHSPFCPHGSFDTLAMYTEEAIRLGMTGLTFTEHAPLPKGFIDPVPLQDSAMKESDLPLYFEAIEAVKKEYGSKITIQTRLEVDFIEGFEEETSHFLSEVREFVEDAILSVHFLRKDNQYVCIDYNEEMFDQFTNYMGGVDAVYELYYNTVKKSVLYNFKVAQPNRIGHMTLVHKFQKLFPPRLTFEKNIIEILDIIKERDLQLDYNGAGMVKPFCKEPYPPHWVIEEAVKRKIPLVYGSDAHSAKGLGQGYEFLSNKPLLTSPFFLDI